MDITIDKDLDDHTLTVVATFDHPIEKVWDLYADPRKLERWWGPPTHPATVTEHVLEPGGVVQYFMTSPEGEKYHGRWDIQQVDAPRSFVAVDTFADAEGSSVPDLPATTMTFTLTETATGSRVTNVSSYVSLEALEQVLAMGMEEGLRGALGQIEAILDES